MHAFVRTRIAILLAAVAATAPGAAFAQGDISGRWQGLFEFIVLGERTGVTPAAMFNPSLRAIEGEPARLGEGAIEVRIANRVGDHFFGRWKSGEQSGEMVCTMRDSADFVCASRKSHVVGTVVDEGALRMCWSALGKGATSGCADLERPSG